MAQTNASINIIKKSENWKGEPSDSNVLTNENVWIEEHSTQLVSNPNGSSEVIELKGLVFLFTNVDLTNCYVVYNSVQYQIFKWDRYTDRKGDFHHIEILYK